MSVMAVTVVRELGLMHMVSGSKTYKTASGVVTQALGQIDEVPVKVGGVQCTMTFMVVDIDSYDVLLRLDLLIKIGAIVDVERGLIQVRHGPGTKVEVLPLTMVNMLQKTNSETMVQEVTTAMANTHRDGKLDAIVKQPSLCEHSATRETNACLKDSDSDTDNDRVGGLQLEELITDESEFENTDLEDLVLLEGPQQMLQLTLQEQADDFMKEEITDADEYADWITWVSDAEQEKQALPRAANCAEVPVLLQVQQVDTVDFHDNFKKQLALSNNQKVSSRWEEICQRIQIDQDLDEKKGQQLWGV
ncbi:unnamed protein product [Sphagnum tenellum]